MIIIIVAGILMKFVDKVMTTDNPMARNR